MEEFPHLLSWDVQDLILESLHNATKGDEYRVGGVNDDNLYPSYSNPVSWLINHLSFTNELTCEEVYHACLCGWLDGEQAP